MSDLRALVCTEMSTKVPTMHAAAPASFRTRLADTMTLKRVPSFRLAMSSPLQTWVRLRVLATLAAMTGLSQNSVMERPRISSGPSKPQKRMKVGFTCTSLPDMSATAVADRQISSALSLERRMSSAEGVSMTDGRPLTTPFVDIVLLPHPREDRKYINLHAPQGVYPYSPCTPVAVLCPGSAIIPAAPSTPPRINGREKKTGGQTIDLLPENQTIHDVRLSCHCACPQRRTT